MLPGGGHYTSSDVAAVAQRLGDLVGVPRAQLGAKAFRIGGATDMREFLGESSAVALIRQRGRWFTDIALIYLRALAMSHLDASAGLGDASGLDLEALCEGWVQRASY